MINIRAHLTLSAAVLAVFAASMLSGCSAIGESGVRNTGTVNTFSLGNIKSKTFAKSPSAEELYNAVLALYESFDTVAATYSYKSVEVNKYSVTEDGKAVDLQPTVRSLQGEYRYAKPHKELTVHNMSGKLELIVVHNGTRWLVSGPEGTVWNGGNNAPLPKSSVILTEFRVVDSELSWSKPKMHRLPDTNIKGTQVYVLQLNRTRTLHSGGKQSIVVKLYLGKADLLPRKMVVTSRSPRALELGLPGDIETWDYNGFEVGVKISDNLFSTTPPKTGKKLGS
ncbi:MAG: hypothetical protein NT018_13035 [Armatimonadetes bacterium]|nr:hypothetical protein [Armatimonadota bacterium]